MEREAAAAATDRLKVADEKARAEARVEAEELSAQLSEARTELESAWSAGAGDREALASASKTLETTQARLAETEGKAAKYLEELKGQQQQASTLAAQRSTAERAAAPPLSLHADPIPRTSTPLPVAGEHPAAAERAAQGVEPAGQQEAGREPEQADPQP